MNIDPVSLEEKETLHRVIEKWESRTHLQQAIAISVLRGRDTPDSVASYLEVGVDDVRAAIPGVYGLLLDRNTQKIWIR